MSVGEFVSYNRWRIVGGVSAALVLGLTLRAPADPEQGYASLYPIGDAIENQYWPVALDPWAWMTDQHPQQAESIAGIRDDAAGLVENIDPPGGEPTPKPLADNPSIIVAANTLKEGAPVHCPELDQTQYIVPFIGEETNPSAKFCLQTDELFVAGNDEGESEVIMNIIIDPTYPMTGLQPAATVEAAFKGATQAQCDEVTTVLGSYGQFLLEGTGRLPAGTTATVHLIGPPGTEQTPCDSWTRPSNRPEPPI